MTFFIYMIDLGLDRSEGLNVDIVYHGMKWPIAEEIKYDLIFSQGFFPEEDIFWITFIKVFKNLKPGGLLQITIHFF